MISTRDLSGLPDIRTFRRLTRSLAVLDAVLLPEWEYRYHSFDAHWAPGELMASMRNGQGDGWFALFTASGVVLIGLDHEASMYRPDDPWPALFDGMPRVLSAAITEPAFDARNSTFCIWRLTDGAAWEHGPVRFPAGDDPDGSADLLSHLDGEAESYRAFVAECYEIDVALDAVAAIYRHAPLTNELIARLNPAVSLTDLGDDIAEIGYPEVSL
jgi:hypothetical protein